MRVLVFCCRDKISKGKLRKKSLFELLLLEGEFIMVGETYTTAVGTGSWKFSPFVFVMKHTRDLEVRAGLNSSKLPLGTYIFLFKLLTSLETKGSFMPEPLWTFLIQTTRAPNNTLTKKATV